MTSPTRSGIFASLLLGLFLVFVLVPRGAQSFVPTPTISCKSHCRYEYNSVVSLNSEVSDSTEDATPPPKPVKCPNCDQCDGSGRYEAQRRKQHKPQRQGNQINTRILPRKAFAKDLFLFRLKARCHDRMEEKTINVHSIDVEMIPGFLAFRSSVLFRLSSGFSIASQEDYCGWWKPDQCPWLIFNQALWCNWLSTDWLCLTHTSFFLFLFIHSFLSWWVHYFFDLRFPPNATTRQYTTNTQYTPIHNKHAIHAIHRIEGGIGVILKFWPIKAYRPCPKLIENGGFYQRSGQGLDEIAFGRDSRYDPME